MIKALFSDIGGVLLTNGWDRDARHQASQKFSLDYEQLNEFHHLTFDTYESGKLTLEEYLGRTIFYEKRNFGFEEFTQFIMDQSKPYDDMISLVKKIKKANNIKLVAVNNEGREINDYRIRTFGLDTFFDFFVSSCYVHFRKPDADIFKLALDTAHVAPSEVIFMDDRPMFVQVASSLGMHAIRHTDYNVTKATLKNEYGLIVD